MDTHKKIHEEEKAIVKITRGIEEMSINTMEMTVKTAKLISRATSTIWQQTKEIETTFIQSLNIAIQTDGELFDILTNLIDQVVEFEEFGEIQTQIFPKRKLEHQTQVIKRIKRTTEEISDTNTNISTKTFSSILNRIRDTGFFTAENMFVLPFVAKCIVHDYPAQPSVVKINAIVENENLFHYFMDLPLTNIKTILNVVSKHNRVDILKRIWEVKREIILPETCYESAASTGACDVMQWIFHKYGLHESLTHSTQVIAAHEDKREVFIWLHTMDIQFSDCAFTTAVKYKRHKLLLYLLSVQTYHNMDKLKKLSIFYKDTVTVGLLNILL
jgi:hypothetical protein